MIPTNGRYTIAQRFCTLAQGHGRTLTPTGERTVRVRCEDEAELITATVAMQQAAGILRVSASARDAQENDFTVVIV